MAKKRHKVVCKPCWEIHYCPYGPLVEDFPLPPMTRSEATEYFTSRKKDIESGIYNKDLKLKRRINKEVKDFNPQDYPARISKDILEKKCNVFGHMCPVFFVSEPFTESERAREVSRYIPRDVMIRVARRDNSTCQNCGKHLLDYELNFDHIIPFSKGGPSTEANLRLTCLDCNLKKGNKTNF